MYVCSKSVPIVYMILLLYTIAFTWHIWVGRILLYLKDREYGAARVSMHVDNSDCCKLYVAGLTCLPVHSTWTSLMNDSGWERDQLTLETCWTWIGSTYKWLPAPGMLHRDDSMSLASWRSYFICYLRATNNGKWESRDMCRCTVRHANIQLQQVQHWWSVQVQDIQHEV